MCLYLFFFLLYSHRFCLQSESNQSLKTGIAVWLFSWSIFEQTIQVVLNVQWAALVKALDNVKQKLFTLLYPSCKDCKALSTSDRSRDWTTSLDLSRVPIRHLVFLLSAEIFKEQMISWELVDGVVIRLLDVFKALAVPSSRISLPADITILSRLILDMHVRK